MHTSEEKIMNVLDDGQCKDLEAVIKAAEGDIEKFKADFHTIMGYSPLLYSGKSILAEKLSPQSKIQVT